MAKLGESILRGCANLATNRPWTVVIVSLVLTALAAYASLGLSVNTSTDEILDRSVPFRQMEIEYQKAFPEEDQAVVVVDAGAPEEANAAARDLLDRLQASKNFKSVELAGSSPYFDRIGLLFLEPEAIRNFGEELRQARRLFIGLSQDPTLRGVADLVKLSAEGVKESAAPPSLGKLLAQLATTIEARAAGRPEVMRWGSFLGLEGEAEGTRRLIVTKPVLDDTSINRAGAALDDIDTAIAATREAHAGTTFRVTGEPVLRQQELNDAFSGAIYASSLSFVLVALSLIIGIRSGRLITALMITLVIGSVWTTGLAALTIGRLNLISVAFLVLFFGLGVDFGTHLGLRHLEEARAGKSFKDALLASMVGEGPPIVLSAVCASLAFLAFVPTTYVGLAEFGIISALGMLVAVVATFTLQPALMALMPPKPKPGTGVAFHVGGWIKRYHLAIVAVAIVVTAVAAFYVPQARIDTNPLNLQDPNTEPVQTFLDLARDPDTSPYSLNVLAPNLDAARALAPKLRDLPGVASVRYVESFVPADQPARLEAVAAARARLGEAFMSSSAAKAAPSDAELAAALTEMQTAADEIAATPDDNPVDPSIKVAGMSLAAALRSFADKRGTEPATLADLGAALTSEMPGIVGDLRAKLSVSQPVTIDDIPSDLRGEWLAGDGKVRLEVRPAQDIGTTDAMKTFFDEVHGVAPQVAGAPASISGAGEAILAAFMQAIVYTVISIGLIVAVLRRRLIDVLLILAPLGVAAIWTIAASVYLELPFNYANIIVIPLLIGLGVASSIHIVVRTHEVVSDSSGTHEEGMHVLDTSTPLAVLVAQLNTVAAFATLAVADHRGLFSMGVLLGISIMFVLIVSLVVLPSFMFAVGMGQPKPAKPGAGGT